MNISLFYCTVALVVAIASAGDILREDNVDLLDNKTLFKEFHACLLDLGPCPTENMKTLKEVLPGYLGTNCSDCSPKERDMFFRQGKIILEKYPKEYKDIIDKFGMKVE